jgi:hypothetical protein
MRAVRWRTAAAAALVGLGLVVLLLLRLLLSEQKDAAAALWHWVGPRREAESSSAKLQDAMQAELNSCRASRTLPNPVAPPPSSSLCSAPLCPAHKWKGGGNFGMAAGGRSEAASRPTRSFASLRPWNSSTPA